ncbi:TolC family outer membrane protein [Rhodanobacter sp. AS-Z3]|uniref:TolC family outer membrane protein n=1 Tax=Rhodanobacter sp. AS-Z3 TaxID=3031330 RepID=UPI002478DDD2|nr:TolC family outer membrane protein [Rhodanobacter sp. AS-Z3]WEN15156.1 TolC family outer membrane protein [Rhodanobacter sp. AS-Z3]
MRLKLLTLALALAAISLPSHGEDLLDAYRDARSNDPVLSQADASRLATGEGVNQARALLLPQVDASFSLSQSNGGNLVGDSRSRSIKGSLSQTVLDFSKYANLKAAHSASDAQNELYDAAAQNLYVRVVAAYFGVLTSEDELTYAKANEDAFRQQFEQSDQRFKVGLSAITDVYQAKAYYEAAKSQTIAAQNALNDSREALAQITGKPTGDLKKLRDDLPMLAPVPADQDAWVKQALVSNPDLLAQKSNLETAQHNISAARAGHLPTITAGLSYGKGAGWSDTNTTARYRDPASTTIGLTLNVPIFSGGLTQSRVRQSIYQRDAAADSMEAQRRQIVRDTLNYYRSVIAGIAQVESAKASVDSGRKALEATRAGFEVGTQTMTNVLLAIQTLTSSESSYSQARHQFILNKLLLKQTAGTAELKDMEQINALLQ